MLLTAGQACYIFGWLNAKYHLLWEDVVMHDHITFKFLQSANISVDKLYVLQPDLKQWLLHGKMQKSDVLQVVKKWDSDIVKDFKLDIGDIAGFRFNAEQLLALGINFSTLTAMGLTAENMRLFPHITLAQWQTLGLTKDAVKDMSEGHLYQAFNMGKYAIIKALC